MSRPGAGLLLRLSVMAVVALWLAWRAWSPAPSRPRVEAVRGTAGASSGENGEWQAAREAIEPSGEMLGEGVRFTGSDGREHALAEFRGRRVLVAFVYTRCPTVCPRLTSELVAFARATAQVPEPPHTLLVSLDPVHDTPQVLAAFAASWRLDPARFTLLRPPPESLPALTRAVGLASRAEAGGIAHSAVVAVLGPDGRVGERRVGLGTRQEIEALWERSGRPTAR